MPGSIMAALVQRIYCCVSVWAILLNHTKGLEIVESPTNMTVIVNSSAVFRCMTKSTDYTVWLLNGTSLYQLPLSVRENMDTTQETVGDNELYKLIIHSTSIWYNGTAVQCLAGDNEGEAEGESVVTDNAILLVQGILTLVSELRGDITTSQNQRRLNISWTAPFSLDITDINPDIWYNIIIHNVTDEIASFVPYRCVKINKTYYIFAPPHPNPCHKYSFTVIPQNGAGYGMQSTHIGALYEDLNKHVFNVTLNKDSDGNYSLGFLLPKNVSEASCRYNTFIESMVPECSTVQYNNDARLYNISQAIIIPIMMQFGCYYQITVQLDNSISQSNSTEGITLDTRELVVSTSFTDRSIYINCTYLSRASSSRCYAILIETYNDYYSADIVSVGGKTFSGLPSGRYAVLVYGMEGEDEVTLSHTHNFYTVLDIPVSAVVISDEVASASASSKENIILGLGVGIPLGILILIILTMVVLISLLTVCKCRKSNTMIKKTVGCAVSISVEGNTAYATTQSMALSARNNTYNPHKDAQPPVYETIQ